MFDFLRQSGRRSPSAAVLSALEGDSLLPGTDRSALGVAEAHGSYSGRKVTYLRVFDQKQAAAQAGDPAATYSYRDLDGHPELVLRAGFIEKDGTVILYARPSSPDAPAPTRAPADRAVHTDVERYLFTDSATDRSRA